MVKSEVLKLLNNKSGSFQHTVNAVSRYVKSPNVLPRVVNRIVLKAQKKQNVTTIDLFKFFYDELEGLVKGTKLCPNTYTAQMFLKSVWEALQLQTLVVNQIRKNYAIMDEPEDIEVVEETPKKTSKKKETPEERKERLRRQAEKMRQAKAQKKQQEKVKEQQKPKAETKEATKVNSGIEDLTPEQREQLNLIRNLKI